MNPGKTGVEKPASRPKKYLANISDNNPGTAGTVIVYSSTRAGAIQTASSYFGVPVERVEISPVYFPVLMCARPRETRDPAGQID